MKAHLTPHYYFVFTYNSLLLNYLTALENIFFTNITIKYKHLYVIARLKATSSWV